MPRPIGTPTCSVPWFGVDSQEAVQHLTWLRESAGPVLNSAIRAAGAFDLFSLIGQGLLMGDDVHMRSQATGALLIKRLAGGFAALGGERVARFVAGNHHFFLTLTMAAAKCASLASEGVDGSTIVSLMSRNGTDMGVRLSGLPARWFVAPAAAVQ